MKYSCRLKDAIEENSALFTISYNASNDTIIYTSTLTDMYYFRIYAL